MNLAETLNFLVFPYVALTIFVVGHSYRYATDSSNWNTKSSEILDKAGLKYGITLFHWGIILTALGHAGGLLIPQRVYDAVGISGDTHTSIAIYAGAIIGSAALIGLILLVARRLAHRRVRATTTANNMVTLVLLLLTVGSGVYNVFFGHYYVLDSVAPWIRSIVTFSPDPGLMGQVPLSYKIHILSAFALLAFSPFSRLVHIWSVPIFYLFRAYLVFRRHPAEA